jgi:hypothetical protein
MAGGAVFAGAETTDVATTAVWEEVATAEPPLFEAVTAIRIVKPTSLLERVYEELVAALTSLQEAPVVSQRRHWYEYDVGELLQVPADADSD